MFLACTRPRTGRRRALRVTLFAFPVLASVGSAQVPGLGWSSDDPIVAPALQVSDEGLHADCAPGGGAARADSHAPLGVMGDHTHHAGGWMLSLRWMRMEMDDLLDGSDELDPKKLLGNPMMGTGYMNVPTDMSMEMLMLGAMYAPTDDVTLMAMVPWVSKSMDHLNNSGKTFTTETQGLGDVVLSALYSVERTSERSLHVDLGLSLPTGSTDERDTVLGMGGAPADARLPYPMQLGSGTFDLIPGVTWTRWLDDWSLGAQGKYVLRLGRNDEGYSLGDVLEASAWVQRRIGDGWSASLRASYLDRANIDGHDDTQGEPGGMPGESMVPTADASLQAARRLDLWLGANAVVGGGHRLAVELGVPAWQHVDGPQLGVTSTLLLGWQFSF